MRHVYEDIYEIYFLISLNTPLKHNPCQNGQNSSEIDNVP